MTKNADPIDTGTKRRWDDTVDELTKRQDNVESKQAVEASITAAVEAASRIKESLVQQDPSSILVAKKPDDAVAEVLASIEQDKEKRAKLEDNKANLLFKASIEINDSRHRYVLTKTATQMNIGEQTSTLIQTRGKYLPDKSMASVLNPALYLEVSGPTQESVDKAVAKIKEIMENGLIEAKRPTTAEVKGTLIDKVFLPFDFDYARMGSYNIRGKMIGPQGAYIKHINASANVECSVRGRGSGHVELGSGPSSIDESIHLYIQGFREEDMKLAKALCEDLLQSVQEEYQTEYAKIVSRVNPPYYGNPYVQMQAGAHGYYNQATGMQYPMGYAYTPSGMMPAVANSSPQMPYTGSLVPATPGMTLGYSVPPPNTHYPYYTYPTQVQSMNQIVGDVKVVKDKDIESVVKESPKKDTCKNPARVFTEEADPLDSSSKLENELKDYSAVPPPPNLNAPSRMKNGKK